jgi:hypothetical protein
MRKLYLVLTLFSLLSTGLMAQMTSASDAKDIKAKKLVIALRPYPKKADDGEKNLIDSCNLALKYAVEKYWTFSAIEGAMPFEEAKDFVKAHKDTHCYMTIDIGVTRSLTHGNNGNSYRYVSSQERLAIYNPGAAAGVYLPSYEDAVTNATAVYAVTVMQRFLEHLDQGDYKNLMGSLGYIKKNGPNVVKKTLLIPQSYVSPKLSPDDVKLAYPYDLEMCSIEKIEQAILEKDPKYAVAYYVPTPVGGKVLHRVFITSTQDGDIYGVADGSNVEIDMGLFSVGGQSNKKYLINSKELKEIAKLVD